MRNKKKYLKRKLKEFRSGKLNEKKIASDIALFGRKLFFEARKDIEKYLNSKNSIIRYNTLIALTLDWHLSEHIKTCKKFLLNDPDEDNRSLAASALGSLQRGTKNKSTIELLLKVFENKKEHWMVRDSAYRSITEILAIPNPKFFKTQLDHKKDVDWKIIKSLKKFSRK